jgi:hypothetical protein
VEPKEGLWFFLLKIIKEGFIVVPGPSGNKRKIIPCLSEVSGSCLLLFTALQVRKQ